MKDFNVTYWDTYDLFKEYAELFGKKSLEEQINKFFKYSYKLEFTKLSARLYRINKRGGNYDIIYKEKDRGSVGKASGYRMYFYIKRKLNITKIINV